MALRISLIAAFVGRKICRAFYFNRFHFTRFPLSLHVLNKISSGIFILYKFCTNSNNVVELTFIVNMNMIWPFECCPKPMKRKETLSCCSFAQSTSLKLVDCWHPNATIYSGRILSKVGRLGDCFWGTRGDYSFFFLPRIGSCVLLGKWRIVKPAAGDEPDCRIR